MPVELRRNVELARTNLVSRMFEIWGEIPLALLQQLDLRNCLCGYIGLEDYTPFPMIRPGLFVEIDEHQNNVKPGNWQNEFRPPHLFRRIPQWLCLQLVSTRRESTDPCSESALEGTDPAPSIPN